MKTAVATSERGDPRPMPQTPWPLVQPTPRRVPNPTIRPAMISSQIGAVRVHGWQNTAEGAVDQRGDEHPARKARRQPISPRAGWRSPPRMPLMPGDAPVQHQEQGGGGADQQCRPRGPRRE